MSTVIVGEPRGGHRPLFAAPTGRRVGWVRTDPGRAELTVAEIRRCLGPADRFDDPEVPNRNRCPEGHYYDEILSGGCPWCPA